MILCTWHRHIGLQRDSINMFTKCWRVISKLVLVPMTIHPYIKYLVPPKVAPQQRAACIACSHWLMSFTYQANSTLISEGDSTTPTDWAAILVRWTSIFTVFLRSYSARRSELHRFVISWKGIVLACVAANCRIKRKRFFLTWITSYVRVLTIFE